MFNVQCSMFDVRRSLPAVQSSLEWARLFDAISRLVVLTFNVQCSMFDVRRSLPAVQSSLEWARLFDAIPRLVLLEFAVLCSLFFCPLRSLCFLLRAISQPSHE